jgi:hypothetical protein
VGIYVYTLRAETRNIDGREIGTMKFAYKIHNYWRGDPGYGSYTRSIAVFHALAEKARWKNRDLTLVILGDFKNAERERLPVHEISTRRSDWADTDTLGPIVGHVEKVGRGYRYIPVATGMTVQEAA